MTATEDFARTFFQYTPAYDSTANAPHALVHLDLFDAQGHRTANYTIPATDDTAPAPTWGARIAGLLSMPVPVLAISTVNHYHDSSVQLGGYGSPLVESFDSKEICALFGLAVVLSGGRVHMGAKGRSSDSAHRAVGNFDADLWIAGISGLPDFDPLAGARALLPLHSKAARGFGGLSALSWYVGAGAAERRGDLRGELRRRHGARNFRDGFLRKRTRIFRSTVSGAAVWVVSGRQG